MSNTQLLIWSNFDERYLPSTGKPHLVKFPDGTYQVMYFRQETKHFRYSEEIKSLWYSEEKENDNWILCEGTEWADL
jgi:hypothetical protein